MSPARLIVITGKGGVGRSTVAAATATRASRNGRRVLAIDASAGRGLALALGCPVAPEPGKATLIDGPGSVTLLELDTEAALEQYVRLQFPTPISPRVLGPVARIFEYVANAAPAVREILTIGKIGHEVKNGPWDLVVVDGPATGHIVELLGSPANLGELVGIGPLAKETDWLRELLADPTITGVVAVSTAEELPVTETLELLARLESETTVPVVGVVLNRWPPPVGEQGVAEAERLIDAASPNAELAEAAVARSRIAQHERGRLAAAEVPIVIVEDGSDPVATACAAVAEATW